MLLAAQLLAGLAAAVHVYIFVLESLRWTHPSTRRVFGTTPETAEVTRQLAYNQGFYNLFLAAGAVAGAVLLTSDRAVGTALVVLSVGSMLAAAVVLALSDRRSLRPAAVQGVFPALALLLLVLA